jgi:hypothetical protein
MMRHPAPAPCCSRRIAVAARAAALLALLFTVACSSEKPAAQTQPRTDGVLRVLFLGSSYTYYNHLPRLVEEFATASGKEIETRMIAPGGATLADHLENRRTLDAIRTGRWDFVVLQEQSMLGAVYLVNGTPLVANPDAFFRSARALDAEIRKAGAKTVFYHTWPRRDAPDSDRAMLDFAYMHIARELGATVAPVGLAWQRVRGESPAADLYAADGSHPSRAGSYLVAAVLARTLLGAIPDSAPVRVSGPPVDPDSGAVDADRTVVLVDLPARFAGELQRAARRAGDELAAAGGYLDRKRPPPPEHPVVPAGRAVQAQDVLGRWIGSLHVYPRPGTLELRVAQDPGRPGEWKAALQVRFPVGTPEQITEEVEQFRLTGDGVSFVNPNGPNGGIVRFRAAYLGNTLAGVAEILVEDQPIYGIGRFEIKRIH